MLENLFADKDLAWEHSSNKTVDGMYTDGYWVCHSPSCRRGAMALYHPQIDDVRSCVKSMQHVGRRRGGVAHKAMTHIHVLPMLSMTYFAPFVAARHVV